MAKARRPHVPPRRKYHRELAAALLPYGFRWVGLDGRDHLMFRHEDGRRMHLPGSPRSTYMMIKIAVSRARRAGGRP